VVLNNVSYECTYANYIALMTFRQKLVICVLYFEYNHFSGARWYHLVIRGVVTEYMTTVEYSVCDQNDLFHAGERLRICREHVVV
jgi:hypothetical protein